MQLQFYLGDGLGQDSLIEKREVEKQENRRSSETVEEKSPWVFGLCCCGAGVNDLSWALHLLSTGKRRGLGMVLGTSVKSPTQVGVEPE